MKTFIAARFFLVCALVLSSACVASTGDDPPDPGADVEPQPAQVAPVSGFTSLSRYVCYGPTHLVCTPFGDCYCIR
ncbi:MAG: hypothetical protein HOO96_16460 [Polyangiaceae bacterium]|nr:hypothetical protein [Polyangiaceae bacterium]